MLRVRVAINGFTGGPGLSTFYFLTPLENAAAATRVLGYVHEGIIFGYPGFLPNSVSLQVSGDVDVLSAVSGDITNTLSLASPAVVQGTGGEAIAPPAVAALLQLRTTTFLAGRRIRGRSFISPLAGAAVTSDGLLSNAAVAGFKLGGTSLLAGLEAGDSWVVWHRPKLNIGGSAAPITAVSVPFKLAVLRSRRD